MRFNFKKTISICCLSLALTACSSVRDELGLNRHSPDEFTVIKRAPLSLPPQYNLRPPTGQQTAPTQQDLTQQTKQTVFGETEPTAEKQPDTPNDVLLKKLGVSEAQPNIRQVLDRENGFTALDNKDIADKIIFWKDGTPPESLIDAGAESERLRDLAKTGQPVNGDNVPVIERKKGAIDRLF